MTQNSKNNESGSDKGSSELVVGSVVGRIGCTILMTELHDSSTRAQRLGIALFPTMVHDAAQAVEAAVGNAVEVRQPCVVLIGKRSHAPFPHVCIGTNCRALVIICSGKESVKTIWL